MPSLRKLLHAQDLIFLGYLLIVSALTPLAAWRIPDWWVFERDHALQAVLVFTLALGAHITPSRWLVIVRHWYFVFFVFVHFRELHFLVPAIHPRDMDWTLLEIDRALFGGHDPTVALERIAHPALTEILQWVYTLYYAAPAVVAVALWRKQDWPDFRLASAAIVLAFSSSYLGYVAVPAVGPRFTLHSEEQQPVKGLWLTQEIRRTLDRLEMRMRDCFPSGHTEITLVSWWLARRRSPRVARVLGLYSIALVFSTVYLRYHYVVDVIAGAAFAAAVIPGAALISRWDAGKAAPEQPPGLLTGV